MIKIYKITNKINQEAYIGKTNNISRRWHDHQRLAFTKGHKEYNKPLYCAFRKYGVDNFVIEILEEIPDNLGAEREQFWINQLNTYNNGYNASLGGDGGSSSGHCQGEMNGRSKLTEQDVRTIRQLYAQGISRASCYEIFKTKISPTGFNRVWQGSTWKHIMPEVYTQNNKKRNTALGKGAPAKKRRILTKEEVLDIRNMRLKQYKINDIIKKYENKASKSCILDVYYNRTYKEIQP